MVSRLTKSDAATRRKTPKIFRGVNLEQEAWRYCQALGFARNVELVVKHSAALGSGGKQWLMVTTLTIGWGESLATVLQILLHEVCHVVHMDHNEEFIARMVQTAKDIWGINIDGWTEVPQGRRECRAYAVDIFLRQRLEAHLKAGGYIPCHEVLEFPNAPV